MKFSLILLAFGFMFQLTAQDTLSLKECFDRAEKCRYNGFIENSNRSTAAIDLRFHKYSALPSLSAFSNLSASFGRSLDQITNTFRTVQVNSQSYGINSSVNLFNGLSFFKERDNLRLIHTRSEEQFNFKLNTLYNQIASIYVDLCIVQTQISMGNQRIEHLRNLLDVQHDLFIAGKITHVDTLRTLNTIFKEESQLLTTMQAFNLSTLQLNVLIGSELNSTHLLDASTISEVVGVIENDEAFSLRLNAIEIKMLEVDRSLSRSRIMPSIDLSGALGTGYSTALKSDPFDPQSSIVGYRDQLRGNLFQSVGLQLSVPIFNKGDYLKQNQIRKIKEDELLIQSDYLEVELNRKRMEITLTLDSKISTCENLEQSVANLKVIYDSSMELYSSGKITFRELDELFMEWQAEIVTSQACKFELMKLQLVR